MYKKLKFEETGKVFVTAGENGEANHVQGSVFKGSEPALVFPVEVGAIHDYWYATLNPKGVLAANTSSPWSISAVRISAKDVGFVLKDMHGIPVGVSWGHTHHAIFYKDWADYYRAQKALLEEVNILHSSVTTFFKCSEKNLKKGNAVAIKIQIFFDYFYENLVKWIRVNSPQNTRLKWVESRFEEMKKEYDKYVDLFSSEMNKCNQ